MDERIARLRAHQKNIERYQSLLKTELTEVEMHYLEKLLSEERFVMGILSASHQRSTHPPDALQ
jgi:hypothetical protein